MIEQPRQDVIAELAYSLWQNEGRVHGRDQEHWFRAQQLLTCHCQPETPPPAPKPKIAPARSHFSLSGGKRKAA